MQAIPLPDDLLLEVETAAAATGQSTHNYVAAVLREKMAQAPSIEERNSEPGWFSLFGALAYLGAEEHERIEREIEDAFEQVEPEMWQ